jgi:hypothetical protein
MAHPSHLPRSISSACCELALAHPSHLPDPSVQPVATWPREFAVSRSLLPTSETSDQVILWIEVCLNQRFTRVSIHSRLSNRKSFFSQSSIMLSFFPSPLASLQGASSCSRAPYKKQKYRSSLQLPTITCATLKHLHLKLLQVLITSIILHTRVPNR